MGNLVFQGPCEECGSSDGFSVYEQDDGKFNATCFVCEHFEPNVDPTTMTAKPVKKNKAKYSGPSIEEIGEYPVRGVKERRLRKDSCDFYGIKMAYSEKDGETITHHYYPFTKDNNVVGYQERDVEAKKFRAYGYAKGDIQLVGQHLFNKGGRSLTITEGVLDAVAVHQAFTDKYGEGARGMAVVSLPNGANTKAIRANWEWVSSFDKIVLMFDMDDKGREAAEEAAKMLPANKAAIASLPLKDASDMVKAGKSKGLLNAFFNAESYTPAGIVSSSMTWDTLQKARDVESMPFAPCMEGLNNKLYGKRLGEITLFTAGTGAGKTQFMREDIYHVLKSTDVRIGICSLEESLADTVTGIMSIAANKRLHLPNVEITPEEYKAAWEDTMADDRVLFLDHQGSVSDDSLLSKIEFMIASGCQMIYLDHITIAVSEAEGSKNEAMDKTMSDLLKLVKRHHIWLGVISHLRKTASDGTSFEEGAVPTSDDLKGSGSLKQIAFDIIAFSRNQYAKTEAARNNISMHVLKSRFTGNTGNAGKASFNNETGRLYAVLAETKELELVNEDEVNDDIVTGEEFIV